MQTTISLDAETLARLGITIEQFEQAASNALGNLSHPETGQPLYFNGVSVTVIADRPEAVLGNLGSDLSSTNTKVSSVSQMRERIKLLAEEMDANEEENRDMQSEIDSLYAKIDTAEATAN